MQYSNRALCTVQSLKMWKSCDQQREFAQFTCASSSLGVHSLTRPESSVLSIHLSLCVYVMERMGAVCACRCGTEVTPAGLLLATLLPILQSSASSRCIVMQVLCIENRGRAHRSIRLRYAATFSQGDGKAALFPSHNNGQGRAGQALSTCRMVSKLKCWPCQRVSSPALVPVRHLRPSGVHAIALIPALTLNIRYTSEVD